MSSSGFYPPSGTGSRAQASDGHVDLPSPRCRGPARRRHRHRLHRRLVADRGPSLTRVRRPIGAPGQPVDPRGRHRPSDRGDGHRPPVRRGRRVRPRRVQPRAPAVLHALRRRHGRVRADHGAAGAGRGRRVRRLSAAHEQADRGPGPGPARVRDHRRRPGPGPRRLPEPARRRCADRGVRAQRRWRRARRSRSSRWAWRASPDPTRRSRPPWPSSATASRTSTAAAPCPATPYVPTAYRAVLLDTGGAVGGPVRDWPWADLTVDDFAFPADPNELQQGTRVMTPAEIDEVGVAQARERRAERPRGEGHRREAVHAGDPAAAPGGDRVAPRSRPLYVEPTSANRSPA